MGKRSMRWLSFLSSLMFFFGFGGTITHAQSSNLPTTILVSGSPAFTENAEYILTQLISRSTSQIQLLNMNSAPTFQGDQYVKSSRYLIVVSEKSNGISSSWKHIIRSSKANIYQFGGEPNWISETVPIRISPPIGVPLALKLGNLYIPTYSNLSIPMLQHITQLKPKVIASISDGGAFAPYIISWMNHTRFMMYCSQWTDDSPFFEAETEALGEFFDMKTSSRATVLLSIGIVRSNADAQRLITLARLAKQHEIPFTVLLNPCPQNANGVSPGSIQSISSSLHKIQLLGGSIILDLQNPVHHDMDPQGDTWIPSVPISSEISLKHIHVQIYSELAALIKNHVLPVAIDIHGFQDQLAQKAATPYFSTFMESLDQGGQSGVILPVYVHSLYGYHRILIPTPTITVQQATPEKLQLLGYELNEIRMIPGSVINIEIPPYMQPTALITLLNFLADQHVTWLNIIDFPIKTTTPWMTIRSDQGHLIVKNVNATLFTTGLPAPPIWSEQVSWFISWIITILVTGVVSRILYQVWILRKRRAQRLFHEQVVREETHD